MGSIVKCKKSSSDTSLSIGHPRALPVQAADDVIADPTQIGRGGGGAATLERRAFDRRSLIIIIIIMTDALGNGGSSYHCQ